MIREKPFVTSNLHFVITAAVDSDFVNLLHGGGVRWTRMPVLRLDASEDKTSGGHLLSYLD